MPIMSLILKAIVSSVFRSTRVVSYLHMTGADLPSPSTACGVLGCGYGLRLWSVEKNSAPPHSWEVSWVCI